MNYINFFGLHTDYGSSRTRSFSDIFPTFNDFIDYWNETSFSRQADRVTNIIPEGGFSAPSNLRLIYELLMSKYANSTIASSDENRFKLECMALIFQYAPAWIKRLEIQHYLHDINISGDDWLKGSMNIINQSLNPSEDPGTDSFDTLSTINQQNVSLQKRDKFKGLAILEELLKTDITESFLNKFKKLFRVIVAPQRPLFYITEELDDV